MGLLLAVLYRYWHLFRRHLSEYLMLWIIPLLFALAVTYLPTVVSSPQQVLARARAVTGLELRSEQELLTYSILLSAIISLVSIITYELSALILTDVRYLDVISTVALCTSVPRYYLATVLVTAPLYTLTSTLYLLPALTVTTGLPGLLTYLYLLPVLVVASYALSLYVLPILLVTAFFLRLRRPWVVANVLVPAILAGSGVYVPATLVPVVLRVLAYTSPVPYVCDLVRQLLAGGRAVLPLLSLIAALLTAYTVSSSLVAQASDRALRRGGVTR